MTATRDVCYRNELGRLTPSLRQFARALVHDQAPETADDLVQATLVSALGCDQRRNGERLVIWLMSTMTGLYRSQVDVVRADTQATAGGRPSNGGIARTQSWGLSRATGSQAAPALGELPMECREVLLLATLVKLTYPQIAETLGVSINTVVARLGRARDLLCRSSFGETSARQAEGAGGPTKLRAVSYLRVVK